MTKDREHFYRVCGENGAICSLEQILEGMTFGDGAVSHEIETTCKRVQTFAWLCFRDLVNQPSSHRQNNRVRALCFPLCYLGTTK